MQTQYEQMVFGQVLQDEHQKKRRRKIRKIRKIEKAEFGWGV
jgi:hypothetical protein